MLSNIHWPTTLWQARQALRFLRADTREAGRVLNATLAIFQPNWDRQSYRPQYAHAPVYVNRRYRRR